MHLLEMCRQTVLTAAIGSKLTTDGHRQTVPNMASFVSRGSPEKSITLFRNGPVYFNMQFHVTSQFSDTNRHQPMVMRRKSAITPPAKSDHPCSPNQSPRITSRRRSRQRSDEFILEVWTQCHVKHAVAEHVISCGWRASSCLAIVWHSRSCNTKSPH